jgi:G3E family GTPase
VSDFDNESRNTVNNSFQDQLAMSSTIVFNKYQTLDEKKPKKKTSKKQEIIASIPVVTSTPQFEQTPI